MKKNGSHSIQRALFIPYTFLFILIFSLIMGYFIFLESSKIKEDTFDSIKNSVGNISDTLDTEVQGLDTLSQNIMYSNLIKQRFENYIDFNSNFSQKESALDKYNNEQNTQVLYDMLTAMIGPNRPVDQIYLYSLNSGKIGVGLDNSTQDISVINMKWYKKVYNAFGSKVLFCGSDPILDRFSSSQEGISYLSLCRVYFSPLNSPQGIVELKLSLKKINDTISSIHRLYEEKIYIYDSEGKLVYPFTNDTKANDYYSQIKNSFTSFNPNVKNVHTIKDNNEYILCTVSGYSGFTTAMVVNNEKLMKPIYSYIETYFIIFLFVLIAVSLLSFFIAKRISKPLNKIYSEIKHFEITSDENINFSEIDTHITELDTLYKALQKMQRKAKEAMIRELELQNREIQSKILALQSQMNPHFLYNTLSTIQAMADEQMNDEIVLMCQSNARILRYISSNNEQLVPLSEEILCVQDFLKSMELRHEGKLVYEINIPDCMLSVQIPKLCLQLIVENAIKFTTRQKDYPWKIEIAGNIDSNSWKISVTDNGPGFTEQELSNIKEKINVITDMGIFPDLELNGMGLMNVLIRLKLLYKNKYIFNIENQDPHGAIITIGAFDLNQSHASEWRTKENGEDKS
jgi:two-component system, sensor histidine kinase YesM